MQGDAPELLIHLLEAVLSRTSRQGARKHVNRAPPFRHGLFIKLLTGSAPFSGPYSDPKTQFLQGGPLPVLGPLPNVLSERNPKSAPRRATEPPHTWKQLRFHEGKQPRCLADAAPRSSGHSALYSHMRKAGGKVTGEKGKNLLGLANFFKALWVAKMESGGHELRRT